MSDSVRENKGAEFAASVALEAENRAKSRDARPLLGLLPFVLRYKPQLLAALLFLLLSSAGTLTLPWAARQLVDGGFAGGTVAAVDPFFMWLGIGLALFLAVAGAARFFFVSWIGERVVADVRDAVYRHITGLSPAFFEVTKTGEVLSRLTTDTTLIQTVVGSTVSIALRNALGGVGAFVLLIITSPKLTGIVLLIIPMVLVPIIGIGRYVRRLSRSSQDRVADTSAFAGESLSAIQTVQAFTHEDMDRENYSVAVEAAFRVSIRRVVARSVMTASVIFLALSGIVLVLWSGAQAVADGSMDGGTVVQFLLYAMILAFSVAALSEVWSEVQRAAGATERLLELLKVEPKIKAPANPIALPAKAEGRVILNGVTFHYPTRPEVSALDGLSFNIKPGETVALVGPSGAGKSTVFQLLLRFYDPQSGAIELDGVNIADADPRDVRRRIAVVQQDAVVFSGTAMENIRYGRPEASDEEVLAASKAALADEFLSRLPQRYATELGERAMTLSGGQRQRLAIARAILRDAPVLLLDEATSALDAESERLVQQALERTMEGRTTLVIAHRLATVVKADRIIVMDKGRVVDTGTHEELIAKGGLYAHLAELQFGGAEGASTRVAAQ